MTTPDTPVDTTEASAQGNSDAPTASVSFGPSEISSYVVAIAGLLASFLGKDFGLTKNAQALGLLIAGLVTLGTSVSRAIKHKGAMGANATVYAAQLAHVATVLTATNGKNAGPSVGDLAAGVSALNTAVVADTKP